MNILEKNEIKLKKALREIDSTIKPEQISRTKDCIKIKANDEQQKQRVLKIEKHLGEEVVTSEYFQKTSTTSVIDYKYSVIIFGVPDEYSQLDIMEETNAN